jgi:hypothetical protein
MQKNHTKHRIAAIRQRVEADESELMHLETLADQCGGYSDYLDEFVDRLSYANTIDGVDERVRQRALSYAGFATDWH